MRLLPTLFPAVFLAIPLCGPGGGPSAGDQRTAEVELTPDTTFALPRILNEISGLAWSTEGHLLAVQDEEGDLFALDPTSGEILFRAEFASDGDFEGVAVGADRVFVLRSDGRVYETAVPAHPGGDQPARRVAVDLPGGCDAESIDVAQAEVRIGCKEAAGRGLGRVRAVYRVPLEQLAEAGRSVAADLLWTLSHEDAGLRRGSFKPSGMTHTDSHVYLVSSVSSTLHRLDPTGTITESWTLPLPQPEGVAVAPDGTVYVASEGAGSKARLAVFRGLVR